jgi:enoyl-CoA hydratase/carnithine racemase
MPAGLHWVALCRRSKPLVAAINGAAIGIGVTMVLHFDRIVAPSTAELGMGIIIGLVPALASTH